MQVGMHMDLQTSAANVFMAFSGTKSLPVALHSIIRKYPAAILNAVRQAIWEAAELDASQVRHRKVCS